MESIMDCNINIHYQRDSSNVKNVLYNETNGDFIVEFHGSGSIYLYKNVPLYLVMDLVGAKSIGKFFNKNIKDEFEYEIIDLEKESEKK